MPQKYRHRHGHPYQDGSRQRTLCIRDSIFLSIATDSLYLKLRMRKRVTKVPSNGHNLNNFFSKKSDHKNSITRKNIICINDKLKSFWISGIFGVQMSSNELKDVELVKRFN